MKNKILILMVSMFISMAVNARCCPGKCCFDSEKDYVFYSKMIKEIKQHKLTDEQAIALLQNYNTQSIENAKQHFNGDDFATLLMGTYPYTTKMDMKKGTMQELYKHSVEQ